MLRQMCRRAQVVPESVLHRLDNAPPGPRSCYVRRPIETYERFVPIAFRASAQLDRLEPSNLRIEAYGSSPDRRL